MFLSYALGWDYWVKADITLLGESARRYALLRVPRPLRGLLLYLRKAYHPADFANDQVHMQGNSKVVCLVNSVDKCEPFVAEFLTQQR
jgi:hypothetical protein